MNGDRNADLGLRDARKATCYIVGASGFEPPTSTLLNLAEQPQEQRSQELDLGLLGRPVVSPGALEPEKRLPEQRPCGTCGALRAVGLPCLPCKRKRNRRWREEHLGGHRASSRDWHAAHRVESRAQARGWREKNPEKVAGYAVARGQIAKDWIAARWAVKSALRRGALIRPAACSSCGGGPPEAHHDDYAKPLEVRWLCPSCHALERRVA